MQTVFRTISELVGNLFQSQDKTQWLFRIKLKSTNQIAVFKIRCSNTSRTTLTWYLHVERWLEKYYTCLLSIIKSLRFYKSTTVSKGPGTQQRARSEPVYSRWWWLHTCPVQSSHLGSAFKTQALWSQVVWHPRTPPETCCIHGVFGFELMSGHPS